MTTTSTHGQGTVRNPARDGRLKDNKAATASNSNAAASKGQGAAKTSAADGRVKDKR